MIIPACTVSPCESGNPEVLDLKADGFPIKYSGMTDHPFFNRLLENVVLPSAK
jgi:hypothetical protein